MIRSPHYGLISDFSGLASHHATLAPATYYSPAEEPENESPQSPTKYQENGHDTFSDFVTLVCQEAQSTQPSIHTGTTARSPVNKVSSYFSSSMYPPPPPAPMARPVAIIRSSGKNTL